MSWESVFKTIAAAVFSIGGAGALVALCVKFAANKLSEAMLQKYEAKLTKEIEERKHELEIETEKYRKKAERLTFVSRIQFETEFSAYREIFDNLFEFANATKSLYPILEYIPESKDAETAMRQNQYLSYCDAFDKYSAVLEKNAPFIPKDLYDLFVTIRDHAHEIGCMFPEVKIENDPAFQEDNRKLNRENIGKTLDFCTEIQNAKDRVREYLSTLVIDKE